MTLPLLAFMNLFEEFRAPSWHRWRDILSQLTPTTREFWSVAGRGSGKSRIVALLACAYATRTYRRGPGEYIWCGVFGPNRSQAAVTFRYVSGLLKSVPTLRALIVAERADSLELLNGIIVEVVTANTTAPRGRAYAIAIIEEAAFLPSDETSANPDVELLRAIRPALARVPGSLLAVISSPYARRGILYDAVKRHATHPDPSVLLVQAPTLELNPSFDASAVARAYEDDPTSAAAEYGAQFRSDVETFISRDVIDACTVPGRHELPPLPGNSYTFFLDFAGGGGGGSDAAACAIAHTEQREDRVIAVLDAIREVRPPFSPDAVCADFAALAHTYHVTRGTADRWGGQFPVEQMRKHGVSVEPSDKSKSELYRELLPVLNSSRVELLDHPRLQAQLAGLERRVARGGRDSIDHAPGAHDDVVNATAGALVLAAGGSGRPALYLSDEFTSEDNTPESLAQRTNEDSDDFLRDLLARGGMTGFD